AATATCSSRRGTALRTSACWRPRQGWGRSASGGSTIPGSTGSWVWTVEPRSSCTAWPSASTPRKERRDRHDTKASDSKRLRVDGARRHPVRQRHPGAAGPGVPGPPAGRAAGVPAGDALRVPDVRHPHGVDRARPVAAADGAPARVAAGHPDPRVRHHRRPDGRAFRPAAGPLRRDGDAHLGDQHGARHRRRPWSGLRSRPRADLRGCEEEVGRLGKIVVRNCFGSIVSSPHVVVDVQSVDEIAAILRDREHYPSPVRAVGSNHSTTACGVAEGGTLIVMRNMDRIVEIRDDSVTVQAGALYIDVNQELRRHGLQFYVNVEIGNLTIGSAACGGTKDASMPGEFGQVASYASRIKMVTPDGELVEVTEDDPELLQATRSSYGLFGVVYEATFKVRP